MGRAAACVNVVEGAVESAVALGEWHALDPALKVRLELAAARARLDDDASASSYGRHASSISADFSVSVDDEGTCVSALEEALSETRRAEKEIERLTLGRDAADASAAAALRIAGAYAARGGPPPTRAPRPPTGDAHIYSDAYGMRPRSRPPRLPRLWGERPSIEDRANPRAPRRPHATSKKGPRPPRAGSPGPGSPLRKHRHASGIRAYPRNPNPKPPPLLCF